MGESHNILKIIITSLEHNNCYVLFTYNKTIAALASVRKIKGLLHMYRQRLYRRFSQNISVWLLGNVKHMSLIKWILQ